MKFYYTFGTDPRFPFYRGWVEVIADNRDKADALFRAMWPDRTPGILNCAFVYTEERFKTTPMYKGHPEEKYHGTLGFYKEAETHIMETSAAAVPDKNKPSEALLYILKMYNDEDPQETLAIELYHDIDSARKALKEEVVSAYRSYGDTIEELMANPYFLHDEFGDDRVVIHNDGNDSDVFEVEEYVRNK